MGKFGRNFAGFLRTHKIKAQTFQEKVRSVFRKKIRNFRCQMMAAFFDPSEPDNNRFQWKLTAEFQRSGRKLTVFNGN